MQATGAPPQRRSAGLSVVPPPLARRPGLPHGEVAHLLLEIGALDELCDLLVRLASQFLVVALQTPDGTVVTLADLRR